jgi:hypothetical protein
MSEHRSKSRHLNDHNREKDSLCRPEAAPLFTMKR